MKTLCLSVSVAIALGLLIGCMGDPIVPVSDLTSQKGRYVTRIVQDGETLYMIAWEAGLDYRQLAEWNKLSSPYSLKAGSRLRLTGPLTLSKSKQKQTDVDEIEDANPAISSGDTIDIRKQTSVILWAWPAKGKVIKQFNRERGSNGIDIAGMIGAEVKAAYDGLVVYAGSGLRGYGELIIVQHNDVYLSAYAHNSRLLVNEGEAVRRGEVIAELGSTATKSPRLHFEIRRNGKPINPLNLLPNY